MANNNATTYTKLKSGAWGLRGMRLRTGTSITVTKKSGDKKIETVGRIVWTGSDGLTLAEITPSGKTYDEDRFNGYGRRRGGYSRTCRTGGNCSSFGSGKSCGADDCDGY